MFFVQQISLRVEEDNITNFSDLIIESITRKFIDTTSLIKLEKLYCFNFYILFSINYDSHNLDSYLLLVLANQLLNLIIFPQYLNWSYLSLSLPISTHTKIHNSVEKKTEGSISYIECRDKDRVLCSCNGNVNTLIEVDKLVLNTFKLVQNIDSVR